MHRRQGRSTPVQRIPQLLGDIHLQPAAAGVQPQQGVAREVAGRQHARRRAPDGLGMALCSVLAVLLVIAVIAAAAAALFHGAGGVIISAWAQRDWVGPLPMLPCFCSSMVEEAEVRNDFFA